MNAREIAYRVFASELSGSSLEYKGEDEAAPAFLITPLGLSMNRVFVAGKLTEKTMKGTDSEPVWNAVVKDVTGNFYLQAGRFQPEAASAIADIDETVEPYVGVVAKIRTWTNDEGKTYVNLRPERVTVIDEATYKAWLLDAAKDLWRRLNLVKTALSFPEAPVSELETKGMTHAEADGIVRALDHYDRPESQRYMGILQSAFRFILPGREIDFGLPESSDDYRDELPEEKKESVPDDSGMDGFDKKEFILGLVEELDTNTKGASRSEIEARASDRGISSEEVETLLDDLMNEGQIYEPNLGYMRKI
ncbi:MAG: glycerol dehydrogenase [Candidatus Methanomethylophilaceae archaeon]|nr:glycerol dehydrogenase [Candidatus Methanomethylophilaceae archaeon]